LSNTDPTKIVAADHILKHNKPDPFNGKSDNNLPFILNNNISKLQSNHKSSNSITDINKMPHVLTDVKSSNIIEKKDNNIDNKEHSNLVDRIHPHNEFPPIIGLKDLNKEPVRNELAATDKKHTSIESSIKRPVTINMKHANKEKGTIELKQPSKQPETIDLKNENKDPSSIDVKPLSKESVINEPASIDVKPLSVKKLSISKQSEVISSG
jgi:hypothetical protein